MNEGEAERAGLYSDDDVVALVKEIRRGIREERSLGFLESDVKNPRIMSASEFVDLV